MKAQIIALVMTLLVASIGYFTYDTSSKLRMKLNFCRNTIGVMSINFTILWVRVMRTLQIGL